MTKMPEISEWVWNEKYRYKDANGTPIDQTVDDTFKRVAIAVAAAEEPTNKKRYAAEFFDAMKDYEFLPAGRILAGAGTQRGVTLFNCFVMGTIADSLTGIMNAVGEAAQTMKLGGGVGMDFSTLRYRGAPVRSVDSISSGAVSFMQLWDSMCGTIMSAGSRRGAMMGVLRCDHPDIEEFIEVKQTAGRLTNFNVSVLVTSAFMKAAREDECWALCFNGQIIHTVSARELWQKILRSTYEYAEPGVIFIDRINETNPLKAIETIFATNPCGEQPLPPYGACLLGSINLAALILNPFTREASLNIDRFRSLTATAIRFLDNVIDISGYALPAQEKEAKAKRRLGLGLTGVADALIMLGMRYGSESAREFLDWCLAEMRRSAEGATAALGLEKGSFPLFDPDTFSFTHCDRTAHRRNSHLLSIAPTGTISLFAGNVSSGIEPVFDWNYTRKVLQPDGSHKEIKVEDYAAAMKGDQSYPEGPYPWITAHDLTPAEHLSMAATAQPHIDSAISKTINCPAEITFDEFCSVYDEAYKLGMKGCTTYRPSDVRGSVLVRSEPAKPVVTDGNVVQIAQPLERDHKLIGATYKLKPAGFEHALYITVNDIEVDGRRRPFEVFFNSKNIDGFAWHVALSRMISAVFRRGGDVSFVADELKSVFDPRGGFFGNGKYVPSLIAAIGEVLEEHMASIGLIAPLAETASDTQTRGHYCPKCQTGNLIMQEGCSHCSNCDYSRC